MNKLKIGSFVNHKTFGDGMVYHILPSIASVVFFNNGSRHDIVDTFLTESLNTYSLDDLIKAKAISAIFDPKTLKKANEYVNTDHIRTIKFSHDHTAVSALVIGTSSYEVSFEILGNRLVIECDCPVAGACKHQAALALFLERNLPTKKEANTTKKEVKSTELGQRLTKLFNETKELDYETLSNIRVLLQTFRGLEPYEVVNLLLELPLDIEKFPFHMRALASNDVIISRLRDYGLSNIDNSLLSLCSLHSSFEPTYFEARRDLVTSSNTADKVNLYHLFNMNYYALSNSLVTATRTNITRLIAIFAAPELIPFIHKLPYISLFGDNKKLLREAYERISDQEKKLEFYLKFEKELMQLGVIEGSLSIKDRLSHLATIKDKNARLNSLDALSSFAFKEGLVSEVSEAILSYIKDQDFVISYKEIKTLLEITSGHKELELIEKIIKGEHVYG